MFSREEGVQYEARSDCVGKRGWLGLKGQEWSNSLAERKRSVLPALTGNICIEMLFTGHRWQHSEITNICMF